MKKFAAGLGIMVALVVGGISTAQAGTIAKFSTTGVSFTGGVYSFDPWPCNSSCANGHAGMNWSGYLNDTLKEGNAVFIQSKIDGYGWTAPTYAQTDVTTGVYLTKKTAMSDPAQEGQLHICRDRGALYPNNCANSAVLYR